MSQDPIATTRRGFLGSATVVTAAATLAAPTAGNAQTAASGMAGSQLAVAQSGADEAQPSAPPRPRDWTQPAAMAIPEEGYFTHEQGRYGPLYPKTPANYGFTIIAKIKPGREEAIRALRKEDRGRCCGRPQCPCAVEAALSALGALRHRQRHVFYVPGNFRYGFRQIHRRRYPALHTDWHQHRVREPRRVPDGLENECASLRQVRPRTPAPELPGVRRIPVCHSRRDQKSTEGEKRHVHPARPNAVGETWPARRGKRSACWNSTTSNTSC